MHGDEQGVLVWEEDGVGICVREGDQPTRGRGWTRQDHLMGIVDINGPLLHSGALYQRGAKDGIYYSIVNEGFNRLTL